MKKISVRAVSIQYFEVARCYYNMSRFLKYLLVLLLGFSVVDVEAKSYRVRDVQNVQRLDSRRFVANPDGILSREAVATLDSICYALKESGIAEVAIVAVDDIRPRDMVGFSQELFEGWGVGDKELDNGLGILLVGDMREIRFHTGYGLEGVLPDALCYRIQQDYMVPYSVRDIAAAAGVNPNTVQRSLEELERGGILHSIRGSGWFVGDDSTRAREVFTAILEKKTAEYFTAMAALGMDETAVKDYVKEWKV